MAELWRDLVELLRRRPVLWLPVLVADLLCYLAGLGRTSLLRALVLHNTAQQSVFGGAVVHGPMTASTMQTTGILALLLSWFVYFVRILLYAFAFAVTAALVKAFAERREKPSSSIGPTLAQLRGGILELALRALAVYAIAALLLSWLTPTLVKSGHPALLGSPWFNLVLGLLVVAALAFSLPPAALRVLAGHTPRPALARCAQYFALILLGVATLLAAFVAGNSREMAHISPAARYPLEIIGSLVVALPYVLLFTGTAILGRREAALLPESDAV